MNSHSVLKDNVSVIVPMYKAGIAVIEALDSIRLQTLSPTVVHIVDDQSPSNDASLARAYITEHRIKNWYVHQLSTNVGAGGARDFGIRLCFTKYIALLDADDIWLPHHLEKASEMIGKFNLVLFGAQMHKMSKGVVYTRGDSEGHISIISLNSLLCKCSFLTSTVIFERHSYFGAGGFLPCIRHSEDYSLWLRLTADPNNCCGVNKVVHALYGDHDPAIKGRLSHDRWAHECAELRNFAYLYDRRIINLFQLIFSLALSLLKYLRRTLVRS